MLFENICNPNLVQDAFNQNIKSMIVVKGIDARLDSDVCFKYVIYTISSIALAETNYLFIISGTYQVRLYLEQACYSSMCLIQSQILHF